jgi:hypothetical protein
VRSKQQWSGRAYEVEAIDAPILRALVEDALLTHIDQHALAITRAVEEEERATFARLADLFAEPSGAA